MFFVLGGVIFITGIVLLFIGLRGRIVGDDPFCRACGFNLRGRDVSSSPRCSECGAELADEVKAIRIGVRQRRWRLLGPGLALGLISLVAMSWIATRSLIDYNFAPWKPATWLFADLDSATPRDRSRASDELKKRIQTPTFPQAKVDWIMDHVIARATDMKQSTNWLMPGLIDAAARVDRIDDERLQSFVRGGVVMQLKMKPKMRVGQQIELKFDFNPTRIGQRSMNMSGSALLMDDREWKRDWLRESNFAGGMYGLTSTFGGLNSRDGVLIPGQHTVHADVKINATFGSRRIAVTRPVSVAVEVFPATTPIDTFTVDRAQRASMRSAFQSARVCKGDTPTVREVRVKADMLPIGVAMDVVLTQDEREYRVGHLLIDPGKPLHWYRVFFGLYQCQTTGTVDVHLRPTQEAADPTIVVANYWGEEIVIPGVTIDAPYDPPFLHDPSLRPQIEKSISVKLSRQAGRNVSVSVNAKPAAIKLAYRILLAWKGREYSMGNYDYVITQPNRGGGFGQVIPEPDQSSKTNAYDVILRPDPQWEAHSYNDAIPPWDGEIILHDVPVK